MSTQTIELQVSADLLMARQAARLLAQRLGMGVMDQTRFATAVSELGRNALVHAGGGRCQLSDLSDPTHLRLSAEISDQGPGIADIDLAMNDGYSTGGGLGAGLPGTRRLVDEFDIRSDPSGTQVRVQIVRRRGA
jgi:serine/threonine-protein kinase RsbT